MFPPAVFMHFYRRIFFLFLQLELTSRRKKNIEQPWDSKLQTDLNSIELLDGNTSKRDNGGFILNGIIRQKIVALLHHISLDAKRVRIRESQEKSHLQKPS